MSNTQIANLHYFTWDFMFCHCPHSVTVLAKTKEEAIEKIIELGQLDKILRLDGPCTEKQSLARILREGVNKQVQKTAPTLFEWLRGQDPRITDADSVIHHSALDG